MLCWIVHLLQKDYVGSVGILITEVTVFRMSVLLTDWNGVFEYRLAYRLVYDTHCSVTDELHSQYSFPETRDSPQLQLERNQNDLNGSCAYTLEYRGAEAML